MTDHPFTGRREDPRLLKGQGCYTADWSFEGELYAQFVRADRAHAEIVSVDIAEARRMPGVVAILTGQDTAALKTPPAMVRYPGIGGSTIKVPHRPVLATDRVRLVGQEVALVVATSAVAAQDAAERVVVDYRDLPAVTDAVKALEPGAPQLFADIPGNLSFDYVYGDEAAANEAFARAAHVTKVEVRANRLSGTPMEPKSCTALYDAARDTYDVYASTQGMSMMLPGLAAILDIPVQKIRLHARDVGGGFGIRSGAYAEYCAVMVAARLTGRPVKWVGSRFESIVSDAHGRGAHLSGELALDREGRFLGLRVQWVVNAGAYLTQAGPLVNTANPASHAINAYRIPALYGRHKVVLTNTTPTTAYRGAGRPNVSYLIERLVDEAARETGIDRVELRRRNLIPRDAFPYKTPVGSTYDSGDPPAQLEAAMRESKWADFPARRKASESRGRLRGIACTVFVEPCGAPSGPKEEAAIKFGESGNPVLYTLSGPSGQGHDTMFAEIVAEIFGLEADEVESRSSDPDGPALVGGGTVGSRSMMSHGGALAVTAREAIRKGLELAAKDLEVSPKDVEFKDGRYRVPGTDLSVTFREIARRYGSQLDAKEGIPMPTAFAGGAHVAEVEVDPETGEVTVENYVAVDDCGRVLNHTLVEGQLHGGIVQGAGQVFGEEVVYDETGQVLTGSFMDYPMPRAEMVTRMDLHDLSVPSPTNPLGVKGAGEAGTTGAVPTLANAVIDALRPLGIHRLELPYSPSRLWQAIAQAKRA